MAALLLHLQTNYQLRQSNHWFEVGVNVIARVCPQKDQIEAWMTTKAQVLNQNVGGRYLLSIAVAYQTHLPISQTCYFKAEPRAQL